METKQSSQQIKQTVREKYGEIAKQGREQNISGCCGTNCCSTVDAVNMAEDYSTLPGYVADADLGLGCGLPTEFAQIKEGDVVVDLGSGAGNDCFIARAVAGDKGKVIGVDFTETMIEKARTNAEKRGYNNVEFRLGDIENLPVSDNAVDVVVSNCVLNLVPDKQRAFAEMHRILKPGGHFSVSDIVLEGTLDQTLKDAAELYVGCVAGAIQKKDYLDIIENAGFKDVIIQKEKLILVPDEILLKYISAEALAIYKKSGFKIWSVTVYGEKPGELNPDKKKEKIKEGACCEPGCCGN